MCDENGETKVVVGMKLVDRGRLAASAKAGVSLWVKVMMLLVGWDGRGRVKDSLGKWVLV